MLYTPVPGTPLFKEMSEQGRMLDGIDLADITGRTIQFQARCDFARRFEALLDWAFWRDFERNGPSLYRMCETMLQGWRRYKNYPDLRVRERFERENTKLAHSLQRALWAAERISAGERRRQPADSRVAPRDRQGIWHSVADGGGVGWTCAVMDDAARRSASGCGVTYEPPTILERRNWTPAIEHV